MSVSMLNTMVSVLWVHSNYLQSRAHMPSEPKELEPADVAYANITPYEPLTGNNAREIGGTPGRMVLMIFDLL